MLALKTICSPLDNLSIEAGVRNLGDKNYEYKEGYPRAAVSGLLGLAIVFKGLL